MTASYLPHRFARNVIGRSGAFVTEFFTTFRVREHAPSLGIVGAAAAVVAAFWVGIYLIDFVEIFGLTSDRGFWWHAFRNRGPVELIQWLIIATVVISSALLSGMHMQRGERSAHFFWLLVAIGFALMLIEDPGDPRHMLAAHFKNFWGTDHKWVEGTVFGIIVAPTIFAFLRYWSVPFRFPQTRLYLLAGGALYALAATTSLFRAQDEFYPRLGDRISAVIFNGEIGGFFVMDFIIEESVELMAGAIFLAGVVMYGRLARSGERDAGGPGEVPQDRSSV